MLNKEGRGEGFGGGWGGVELTDIFITFLIKRGRVAPNHYDSLRRWNGGVGVTFF